MFARPTLARSTRTLAATLLLAATPVLAGGCWQWHDGDPGADAGSPRADAPAAPDAPPAADAGPGCPPGEAFFYPGCGSGEDVRIEAGCYVPCDGPADLASCPLDTECRRTDVNPCVCGPGEGCCAACGAEAWLCLPPAPSGPCEGRSYCDCVAGDGCEPLVDLSTGCICPCDEPFQCGGPPCDCACGGATYLGCAAAGACSPTEISCDPGCVVVLAGCPSCACDTAPAP